MFCLSLYLNYINSNLNLLTWLSSHLNSLPIFLFLPLKLVSLQGCESEDYFLSSHCQFLLVMTGFLVIVCLPLPPVHLLLMKFLCQCVGYTYLSSLTWLLVMGPTSFELYLPSTLLSMTHSIQPSNGSHIKKKISGLKFSIFE